MPFRERLCEAANRRRLNLSANAAGLQLRGPRKLKASQQLARNNLRVCATVTGRGQAAVPFRGNEILVNLHGNKIKPFQSVIAGSGVAEQA